jgi:hypothetical protein
MRMSNEVPTTLEYSRDSQALGPTPTAQLPGQNPLSPPHGGILDSRSFRMQ